MKVRCWLPWIILITLALSGCGQEVSSLSIEDVTSTAQASAEVAKAASPLIPPLVSDGKRIYDQYCASCHESSTHTQSQTQKAAKTISSDWLRVNTPKELFDLLTNGLIDQGMPSFTQLSSADRWDIVSYLLLHDLSETDKRSGKLNYQNMCLSCHGMEGQGDGNQAISKNLVMPDWQGTPLLADYSDQEIYDTIRSGKGHDMSAYAVMLSEAQILSITKIVRLLSIQESMNFSPQSGLNQNNNSSGTVDEESEGFFAIEGNVINISGGSVNTDDEVQLKVISNGQTIKEMSVSLLSDGSFRFYLVPYHSTGTYVATFSHNGISFRSTMLYGQNYASATTAKIAIHVYDTSTDTSVLRGEQVHVLLNFKENDVVHVVEYLLISNPSSYIVSPVSDQTPLLKFDIPITAQSLQFSDSTEADYFQLVEGGFGDWQPIGPGSVHQVMFEYDLPFNGDDSFGFTLPVATESVLIMVQDRSNQILCKGMQHLDQKSGSLGSLDLFSGINIPAGGKLNMQCYNKNELFPEIIGAFSLLFVLVIIGIIFIDVKRKQNQSIVNEVSDNDKTEILDAIIALDDRFKAGELSAEVYKAKRQELLKKIEGE